MVYDNVALDRVTRTTRDRINDSGWYYIYNTKAAEELLAKLLLLGAKRTIGADAIVVRTRPVQDGDKQITMYYALIVGAYGFKQGVWQIHLKKYKAALSGGA